MKRALVLLGLMMVPAAAADAEFPITRPDLAISSGTTRTVSSGCTMATISTKSEVAIDWRCVNRTRAACQVDRGDAMVCGYAELIGAIRDGTARSLP